MMEHEVMVNKDGPTLAGKDVVAATDEFEDLLENVCIEPESRCFPGLKSFDDGETKTELRDDVVAKGIFEDPLDDLYITEENKYFPNLPPGVAEHADPFALSKAELSGLSSSIRSELLSSKHTFMNQAAAYFFQSGTDGGKKVRPVMVMLLSRALADHVAQSPDTIQPDGGSNLFTKPQPWQRQDLSFAQRRLAQVSEMVHTASLFHDDVIDESDTRRGSPAVHKVYSNKIAILAGDFLLSQSIVGMAELRNVDVLAGLSKTVSELVSGELMQMRGTPEERSRLRLIHYLRKTYYKTASLMANTCKSAALLGDHGDDLVAAAYYYGKHIGMAFQLVDDILDYEGMSSALGKPSMADLKAGLATAPVLFAAEEFPALDPLIDRKFKEEGDVDQALQMVFASSGLARTKKLAQAHAEAAMDAVLKLSPSLHRDSLIHLAMKVIDRTK